MIAKILKKGNYTKSRLVELQLAVVKENIKSNNNRNCIQQEILSCGNQAEKTQADKSYTDNLFETEYFLFE